MMLGRGGVTQVLNFDSNVTEVFSKNLLPSLSYALGWGWRDVLPFFKASEDQMNPSYAKVAPCSSVIWVVIWSWQKSKEWNRDHLAIPRTPFTTQWVDPSLLGTSSSRLLFLMLFSMQVIIVIGIVIPVLLVFHASLCFIMFTMLIMLIMFNVKGEGRVSPWGTSTQAMPLGSHSCRWWCSCWWKDDNEKNNIDDDYDHFRQPLREVKDRAQQKHFYDLHCAKENRSLCWLKQRLIGFLIIIIIAIIVIDRFFLFTLSFPPPIS